MTNGTSSMFRHKNTPEMPVFFIPAILIAEKSLNFAGFNARKVVFSPESTTASRSFVVELGSKVLKLVGQKRRKQLRKGFRFRFDTAEIERHLNQRRREGGGGVKGFRGHGPNLKRYSIFIVHNFVGMGRFISM